MEQETMLYLQDSVYFSCRTDYYEPEGLRKQEVCTRGIVGCHC